MKKRISKILLLVIAVAVLGTGLFAAVAEENRTSVHEHEYVPVGFDGNVVDFQCSQCGEFYSDAFDEHINEEYCELFDFNGDGIVNAKDYAIINNMDINGEFTTITTTESTTTTTTKNYDTPIIPLR